MSRVKSFFIFLVSILVICSLIFAFLLYPKKQDARLCTPDKDSSFKLVMMSDLGGVNDQSFNQSAWEGLQSLKSSLGDKVTVAYAEPKQTADFFPILDKFADGNNDLIYSIGYSSCDTLKEVASLNLDKNFVMVDYNFG